MRINKKTKENITGALGELNSFIWRNNTDAGFKDSMKAICTICKECSLEVSDVWDSVDDKENVKQTTKQTSTRTKKTTNVSKGE